MALLFDDGFLQNATQSALTLLAINPEFHIWDDIRETLLPRFPALPENLCSDEFGSTVFYANDQGSPERVEMNWRGPHCWVTLVEAGSATAQFGNTLDDIPALRRNSCAIQHPIWHLDGKGLVVWIIDCIKINL